ncbi:polyprenol monophosphomannose synthase [Candidatus Actinomarina]|nr:polyprenol monophosphomannose synthase [Candidatus Actinomarina sp.]|tara:strand:- start:15332 stop:16027 length:696 start_codon:yes stop_codon:yes gene_type:complete
MQKILLITPTYNESENIEKFIDSTLKFKDLSLLVVDDNSPDGTASIVERNMQNNSSVKIIKRSGKLGYGSAIIEGYKWGMKNGYDYFIQMDTDFSHRFEDLEGLIQQRHNYDLVIGSRYVPGGATEGWTKRRQYLSKYANKLCGLVLKSKVKDQTSGFRLLNKKIIADIVVFSPKVNGYAFLVEITNFIEKSNYKIKEVPITFYDRSYGTSKMNYKIILEAMLFLIKKIFV